MHIIYVCLYVIREYVRGLWTYYGYGFVSTIAPAAERRKEHIYIYITGTGYGFVNRNRMASAAERRKEHIYITGTGL